MKKQSDGNLICMFTGRSVIPSVFHCSLQCPLKSECDLSDTCCMEDQETCGQDNCPWNVVCLSWKHHFVTEPEYMLIPLRHSKAIEHYAIKEGICMKDEFASLLEKYKHDLAMDGVNIDLIS
jgi:hypothetical protein